MKLEGAEWEFKSEIEQINFRQICADSAALGIKMVMVEIPGQPATLLMQHSLVSRMHKYGLLEELGASFAVPERLLFTDGKAACSSPFMLDLKWSRIEGVPNLDGFLAAKVYHRLLRLEKRVVLVKVKEIATPIPDNY
jgi:hypothetical protein